MREYLHGIISAPAKNISPTTENLERLFGSDSDAFLAGNLLLKEDYEAHRNDPTVAIHLIQEAQRKGSLRRPGEPGRPCGLILPELYSCNNIFALS